VNFSFIKLFAKAVVAYGVTAASLAASAFVTDFFGKVANPADPIYTQVPFYLVPILVAGFVALRNYIKNHLPA